jgi:hypothetical protein
MDPERAARVRLANAAREDPECANRFSELAYAARAALRRPGVALTAEEKNQDITDYEAADKSTLDASFVPGFDAHAAFLRDRGWDAHR